MIEVFTFFLGSIIGSFSKCQADRYQTNDRSKRSHCNNCGHILKPYELVPILSFILLKGRCKKCGNKIGKGVLIAEIISGLTYLLIFLRYGISFATIFGFLLYGLILTASLIDIRLMIIPNIFPLSVILLWVIKIIYQLISGQFEIPGVVDSMLGGILIPVFILGLSFLMMKILKKETLGMGDIKILIGLGLIFGFKLSILNVFLMSLIGIIYSIFCKRNTDAPFALMPSIGIASMITYVFGNNILELYMSLL